MTPHRGIPAGEPAGGWSLHGDTHPCEVITEVRIPGEPQSKARARRGADGHFYTPRDTADTESDVKKHLRAALPRGWKADPAWSYGVRCIFVTADHTRRDGDNMLKLIQDAANKVVWADDWQVEETAVRIVRGALTPCTYVQMYRVRELPPRRPPRQRTARARSAVTAETIRARLRAKAPGRRILPD